MTKLNFSNLFLSDKIIHNSKENDTYINVDKFRVLPN